MQNADIIVKRWMDGRVLNVSIIHFIPFFLKCTVFYLSIHHKLLAGPDLLNKLLTWIMLSCSDSGFM